MTRPLLIASLVLMATPIWSQDQRKITARIQGAENDTIFLANYYGNKLFYADTATANAKGAVTFARPKGYKAGVYAIVVPGPKYFEFILNEPEVELHTALEDLMGRMVVDRSEENKRFFAYIKFLNRKKAVGDSLRTLLDSTDLEPRKVALRADLEELDNEVKGYQNDLISNAPDLFVSEIVRMSLPADLPQVRTADGKVDSVASYYQYRAHFWDNVDLKDERILGTPVFQNKFDEYIGKVVPQIPDTINTLADDIIQRLSGNRELFKFAVNNISYKYETSDIMGMDAVFVHMAQTYYCPKPGEKSRAFWMAQDKLDKLCERADKLAPLVIGAPATELILTDSTEENWISMNKLPNDYIVLVFWDPHCGHCKKEIPALYKNYAEKMRGMGIEVYAVAKATDSLLFRDWKKFIVENALDWVNVGLTWHVYTEAKKQASKFIPRYTTLASLNYSETYDVYATPKLFLIGPERTIVGKQLTPEQIEDLVTRLRERDKLRQ
ncbi:MAG: DUF5106 domain-containing protein [Flavobacteriales bacterium]|nr:DUF5106 domain-containing protein [Flavobacteriales bacterium]MCB9167902.1 DUF5106 domain-containing protein [Flavobacteriales bacterium]